MDTGAIPAMSMELSAARLQQAAQTSILKKAMDIEKISLDTLLENVKMAQPQTEHIIDVLG